jgi:hypothetical protein
MKRLEIIVVVVIGILVIYVLTRPTEPLIGGCTPSTSWRYNYNGGNISNSQEKDEYFCGKKCCLTSGCAKFVYKKNKICYLKTAAATKVAPEEGTIAGEVTHSGDGTEISTLLADTGGYIDDGSGTSSTGSTTGGSTSAGSTTGGSTTTGSTTSGSTPDSIPTCNIENFAPF